MHYIIISDKDAKVMNKPTIFKSNKPKLPCIFSKLVLGILAKVASHKKNIMLFCTYFVQYHYHVSEIETL